MNIIIFGATGVAGSGVLEACLRHPGIDKITVITRRSTGIIHEKLTEVIHRDFSDFSTVEPFLQNLDACLYCLGVSQTQVPGEEEYNKVTYGYTMAAAKALNRINRHIIFCYLSAAGADPSMKSRLMWMRIKGKTENELNKLHFGKLFIFRPGVIHAQVGARPRLWAFRVFDFLYPVINLLVPSLVTTNREIGCSMINAILGLSIKNILSNRDIRILSGIDSGLGVLS